MKRDFLILYGWNGSSPGYWQFWLAQGLAYKGEFVQFTSFPDETNPFLEEWLSTLKSEFKVFEKDCKITTICHSLAVPLWLHAAKRCLIPKVHRLYLVAPPWLDETDLPIHSFLPPPIDRQSLIDSAINIKLVYSLSDPVYLKTARTIFEKPLGLEGICLPKEAGHINIESGCGLWPKMLAWCLSE